MEITENHQRTHWEITKIRSLAGILLLAPAPCLKNPPRLWETFVRRLKDLDRIFPKKDN